MTTSGRDVLFITIDSLRASNLGCYGYDRDTTPRIDGVADSGHVFSSAFAHAGATRASFPSILTSSYPLMYGGFRRLSRERTLVSEALKEEGYSTGGFHSNVFLSDQFGYNIGWDRFYDSGSESTKTYELRSYIKNALDQDGYVYGLLKRLYDATEKHVGVEVGSAYVKADKITDRAIEWVEKMDSSPRFLWVHYMDVHHPYVPPAEFQMEFRDSVISDRESVRLRRKMLESPESITNEELRALISLYDAEIRFADSEIGRLIDVVEEEWGEDVFTVISSDHGEEFREHGRFSHHSTFYDEVIHVPLIVDCNDGGGHHNEIVGLVDVVPTFVDVADGVMPDNFYGDSILKLIDGGEWTREGVFSEIERNDGSRRISYRTHDWKYIMDEDGGEELYDLESDPDEEVNVVNERDDVAATFREKVREHIEEVQETSLELDDVEVEGEVKTRLEDLGYR